MVKIKFKSSASSEIFDACVMIKDGFSCLFKLLLKLFDKGVHNFPYVFIGLTVILAIVVSIVNIGSARAERDAACKKLYYVQQSLDSLKIVTEGTYHGTK